MSASGRPRRAGDGSDDRTDPGGPAPEVLAEARRDSGDDDAPAAPSPGDATLIYDKNKRAPASDAPRLLVVAGPRAGSELLLTEPITTVGRGSDNVLVVPDISVSRRHVVIERDAGRYLLVDQGSGNGTRLNGRSVDRARLQGGDEIAIGDTLLKFVEPGGVAVRRDAGRASQPLPPPEPLEGPREDTVNSGRKTAPPPSGLKVRGPLYAGIGAALVVVFAVGFVRRERLEAQREAAARQQDEGQRLAQQRFEEGVQRAKEGRWQEARDKLRVAAELAPQDGDVQRYLERAEAEAPRAQALQQARAALGRREFAQVKQALASVPADSALAEQAHELSQQLKAALDGAVREAKALVESGDGQAAAPLLDAVLAAEPGRSDAQAVREAAAGSRRQERAAHQSPPRRQKSEPGPAPLPPAASEIIDAYLSGDIGAAMEKADAGSDARSQRLSHELKAFDAAWRDGLAKTQGKRLPDAIRALEQADKIDRGLAGAQAGSSKLGREVRRALGNLHYNLGVQQMAQEETLAQAAGHLRAALASDPENEEARGRLTEVTDRVKELYQRAYFEKDSEPDQAKRLFRLVAEALGPSDELGQKARKWAGKLDNAGKASE
jgi:pSer/pThr/pTyr-binding forkhead associated (FHA) protein